MKIRKIATVISALALCLLIGACVPEESSAESPESEIENGVELIAVISPTDGNEVEGTVVFTPADSGKVLVTAKISGLEPDSRHGFHIHQYGNLSAADGTSAGGHFNPEGHPHGLPDTEDRHAGDLGNLEANAEGVAEKSLEVSNLSLVKGENSILGRAVMIHGKADTGGQPTGEAGPRIGIGVIGYKNAEKSGAGG